MKDCCKKIEDKENQKDQKDKGFLQGVFYGILPHSFCIAFVVFSVLGATVASTIFRKFLLIPYFFEALIGLSFIFATISAIIYLKKKEGLSVRGIRESRGYLGILYGTTVAVNLLLFLVVFPATANTGTIGKRREIRVMGESQGLKTIILAVKIPCSGHASLISGEIRNIGGIGGVKFSLPNLFEVSYDSKITNVNEILGLEIFKTYPAVIRKEGQGEK